MFEIATLAAPRKRARHDAHPARTPGPASAPDAHSALRRLLPVPLAEVGAVLGAVGIARHVGQQTLNDLIRTGEVRLAHSDRGVLVVAAEAGA